MAKTTKRDLTISGLERCGWVQDIPPGRKYLAFRKHGDPRTYYVGNSGALRMSRRGTVTGSLSLTGSLSHRSYQEVGNPHYRFASIEQAMDVWGAGHAVRKSYPVRLLSSPPSVGLSSIWGGWFRNMQFLCVLYCGGM